MMDLDDRVNRLEGDLTRFRRFTLLLSGFLAIVLLSAFRPQVTEVVQARLFEVVDSDGEVVAFFGSLGLREPLWGAHL